jgi:hypothetical protein
MGHFLNFGIQSQFAGEVAHNNRNALGNNLGFYFHIQKLVAWYLVLKAVKFSDALLVSVIILAFQKDLQFRKHI